MAIPLACFGLEHDAHDPLCCACPHATECVRFMGTRAHKIPLSKLRFDLVPPELREKLPADDPEVPHLRVLYTDCYRTVFGKKPPSDDSPDYYRDQIVKNARRANCSVRLFLLANMVAQSIHEQTLIAHDQKGRSTRFHAKLLQGAVALTRAEKYAKTCHDRYGTFSLSSLAAFRGEDYEANSMEDNLLHSEITAGQFIVARKIHRGGDPFAALYREEELQLHPYWLAIEPSYKTVVLAPYLKSKTGPEMLKNHRFNVCQAIGQLKRSRTMQTLAFKSRQKIMNQAVEGVLAYFNVRPDDLLHEAVPVVDPMALWIQIGRTLQQYHCWLLLEGEPSYFTPRSTKKVHFDS